MKPHMAPTWLPITAGMARAGAGERHVHDLEAGHAVEDLAGEMIGTADAGRGVEQLARLRARERDVFARACCAGTDGCTTSTTVLRVSSDTGAKSFSGS